MGTFCFLVCRSIVWFSSGFTRRSIFQIILYLMKYIFYFISFSNKRHYNLLTKHRLSEWMIETQSQRNAFKHKTYWMLVSKSRQTLCHSVTNCETERTATTHWVAFPAFRYLFYAFIIVFHIISTFFCFSKYYIIIIPILIIKSYFPFHWVNVVYK